jgi:hypothetical protein
MASHTNVIYVIKNMISWQENFKSVVFVMRGFLMDMFSTEFRTRKLVGSRAILLMARMCA